MNNKKNLYIIASILVAAVITSVAVVAMSKKKDNTPTVSTDTTKSVSKVTPVETNSVKIVDYKYSPAVITVKVGTKVTWTNNDSVKHTVTADLPEPGAPASDLLGNGQDYSTTFTKAGTYTYHCEPHPYMKGTVIVTE